MQLHLNYTQHSATCVCGASKKQPHAVAAGLTPPGIKPLCILCGGAVDKAFDKIDSSTTIQLVSDNGSYVLPNGVIVLVDEDIEAYLKGTLEFHSSNYM